MNEEILKKAGIDYEDGVRRCGDSADLYEKLLGMFLEDENFQAAKACLDGGDYEGLFQHVHEIKNISGNVSITDLYRTSSHVVALLRAKDYDNIPAAFNEMADAYKMAVEAIKAS